MIAIVFSVFACKYGKDDFTKRVEQYFLKENVEFAPTIKRILIIPGGGCPGCIASGIEFAKRNKEFFSKGQGQNLVIFTGIVSKKILYRRVNEEDLLQMNAMVDTANLYLVDFEAYEYPMILYMNNGEIVKAESQSPESDALKNLDYELH